MSQNDPRLNLYGRPCTKEEIAKEVAALYLGESKRHKGAQSPTLIAQILGYKQPKSVYNYMDLAVEMGLLTKTSYTDNTGKPKSKYDKPEIIETLKAWSFHDKDKFKQNPLVKDWIEHLQSKGKKSWSNDYNKLKNYCNTFKKNPEQLLPPVIKNWQELESILDKELGMLKRGEVVFSKSKRGRTFQRSAESHLNYLDNTFHHIVMSIRLFVTFHGVSIPDNVGGVLSGKVRQHGEYADIRLTLEEIKEGERFILDNPKYGLDSDLFRVYSVGIDSGARKTALLNMECSWEETKHPKTGEMIFVMKAYESKTDSTWKKYITNPKAQESLRIHRAKGKFSKIISTDKITNAVEDDLAEQLREVYRHLGKEKAHLDENNIGYFMKKPYHTLRHISAQYYITKTKNYTAVTFFCGWKSEIELRNSYGEMPAELLFETLGVASLA